MHYSYTIKLNHISSELAVMIKNFIKECEDIDQCSYDIFIENNSNFSDDLKCFYLFQQDNKIIGILSAFVPSIDESFIYGCTHPDFRHKGIFSYLYNEITTEFNILNIPTNKITFPINPCNSTSSLSVKILESYGFSVSLSNLLMKVKLNKHFIKNKSLELEYEENEFSLWLNDTYIGGCLIFHSDQSTVTIFEYEILEKYRGIGYGKYGLHMILDFLAKNNYKHVILHVTKENKKAYNLYISCGFKIICEEKYFSKSI